LLVQTFENSSAHNSNPSIDDIYNDVTMNSNINNNKAPVRATCQYKGAVASVPIFSSQSDFVSSACSTVTSQEQPAKRAGGERKASLLEKLLLEWNLLMSWAAKSLLSARCMFMAYYC